MSCDEARLALGVYVTGAIDTIERTEVDTHLASCTACRAELAEISGLPALLDRLTLDDLNPVPLPADLFDRVAAKARAEQATPAAVSRTRGRRLLAVAAALVIVTGGGLGAWAALHGPKHFTSPTTASVQMDVVLASQATGTSYTVNVSGLPTDEHCKLIAVADDGTRDVAGEWDATYDGDAKETGSISIARDQLAKLVLLGTDGTTLSVVKV
ncbi:MAG: zf-HC2 domain-containing protein [Frankiaceae bacterium]|nr:zf-HC2 domain-containing protein [Frankiaceae bacterium]MBV9872214.1 zf-HC2 domain-containing protein [Frankiaceae bacterium]